MRYECVKMLQQSWNESIWIWVKGFTNTWFAKRLCIGPWLKRQDNPLGVQELRSAPCSESSGWITTVCVSRKFFQSNANPSQHSVVHRTAELTNMGIQINKSSSSCYFSRLHLLHIIKPSLVSSRLLLSTPAMPPDRPYSTSIFFYFYLFIYLYIYK